MDSSAITLYLVASLFASLPPHARTGIMKALKHLEGTNKKQDRSIPQILEEQARRHPQWVAVEENDLAVSYGALNERANRLARAILAELGVSPEPIALLAGHGVGSMEAILAVMKAGKFYVPLNGSHPPGRLSYLMRDAGARLILTDAPNAPLAHRLAEGRLPVVNLDALPPGLSGGNLDFHPSPDDVAYILYTSGSTGQPKGVYQSHRNALRQIDFPGRALWVRRGSRVALLTPYGYIGSVSTIVGAWLSGATILPYDLQEKGVSGLADWLIEKRVSSLYPVPTVFRRMLEGLEKKNSFPLIRLVSLGGEPIRKGDVELFQKHFSPTCLLLTGYGCTETGTIAYRIITSRAKSAGSMVPSGHESPGVRILLLDESGREVAPGEMGEIAVRSGHLALGYWNRPDLTAQLFKPAPEGGEERLYLTGDVGRLLPDGQLLHLGRKDLQVKIRGHRVEPAEVAAALLEHPSIRDTTVVGRDDPSGEKRLVAYLVPREGSRHAVDELRLFLRSRLPDHMVPSAFVTLGTLPTLPNGKVDIQVLPDPDWERPDGLPPFVAPRTPLEQQLATLWTELLGVERVGVHDDFSALGGNSIQAAQLLYRVLEGFQAEITIGDFFQNPTLDGLARTIVRQLAEKAGGQELAGLLAELEQLSDDEARLRLAGTQRL